MKRIVKRKSGKSMESELKGRNLGSLFTKCWKYRVSLYMCVFLCVLVLYPYEAYMQIELCRGLPWWLSW